MISTSWPLRARSRAIDRPTTPPPAMATFTTRRPPTAPRRSADPPGPAPAAPVGPARLLEQPVEIGLGIGAHGEVHDVALLADQSRARPGGPGPPRVTINGRNRSPSASST